MGTDDPSAKRESLEPVSRTFAPSASRSGDTHAGWARLARPIGITILTAVSVDAAFSVERAGTVWFWVTATLPSVVFGAYALWRARRDGELLDWLKPVWGDPTRGLATAAVLVGAAFAFVRIVAPEGAPRASWMARLYLQFGDPTSLRVHVAPVAIAVVVAAAAEEIVWRGLVTRQIAEAVGSRTAWVWAAALYALAQTPTLWRLRDPVAGPNPMVMLAALALGLAWGLLGRVFRRLVPGILSHAAFDWCVLMMFRLWGPGV